MHLEVNRTDIRTTRVVSSPAVELAPGQIRLAVERLAVTTNNVTYAVAGDMLDYWGFFPTELPWGQVPAMGLGSVIESAHPEIETGGRYFGFYPMADESVITAEPLGKAFRDVGSHRANHASVYTDFRNVDTDDGFDPAKVDEYLLLWGMFMTSFLVDDYLGDNDFMGAKQTLVTSASSKTSISLASCLARRDGHRAVGVTSERNRPFVEGLGLYDQVITYDEVHTLDPAVGSGMVDMAGNATVRSAIHNHFGDDNMRFSMTVGATHWDADSAADPVIDGAAGELPGPTPEFFFAPAQSAKRSAEWGPSELGHRVAESLGLLLANTDRWLTVEHRTGADGVASVFGELVAGQADPALGFVVSMSDTAFG